MGDCYRFGYGVEKDYEEAVKWYQEAADQGDEEAQNILGDCYRFGWGVEKDYEEAVKWYQEAADQGNADAQRCLGDCYRFGNGVEKNEKKAVEWYREAADQGDAEALKLLGDCYRNGDCVAQNKSEAIEWYHKAAAQGNIVSMATLGKCYYTGEGVKQDDALAYEWFMKAAADNDPTEKFYWDDTVSNEKIIKSGYHYLVNGAGLFYDTQWIPKSEISEYRHQHPGKIARGMSEFVFSDSSRTGCYLYSNLEIARIMETSGIHTVYLDSNLCDEFKGIGSAIGDFFGPIGDFFDGSAIGDFFGDIGDFFDVWAQPIFWTLYFIYGVAYLINAIAFPLPWWGWLLSIPCVLIGSLIYLAGAIEAEYSFEWGCFIGGGLFLGGGMWLLLAL